MNTFVNERNERGDLYSFMTRSFSNDQHIRLKKRDLINLPTTKCMQCQGLLTVKKNQDRYNMNTQNYHIQLLAIESVCSYTTAHRVTFFTPVICDSVFSLLVTVYSTYL